MVSKRKPTIGIPATRDVIRRIDIGCNPGQWSRREWLVTNGLGGYASGTISGVVVWRYHGLLIAALPAPMGRVVMLNHLAEYLVQEGRELQFGGEEQLGSSEDPGQFLREFRLENGLPVWRFQIGEVVLEKHVLFVYTQNTVHVQYRVVSAPGPVQLLLRPSIHFRGHQHAVDEFADHHYELRVKGAHYEISSGEGLPCLRLMIWGEQSLLTYDGGSCREIFYQHEADRGYPSRGTLWSPGCFTTTVRPHAAATLIASTEPWHSILALNPQEALGFYHDRHRRLTGIAAEGAGTPPGADLVLAADHFIVTPAGRLRNAARAHAAGDEVRTIVAGYHWFTDWGRDTMISLEGLTLTTRRYVEAAWILRTFAYYIRDGLIPNLFPEGENEGLYHTADATFWFFHALDRYLAHTGDRHTLRQILPKLIDIVDHHVHGTRFGIHVDPGDGLLCQGAEGYQLTWMDAKVEGWVVTPRRGKAVEINGLWFNALKLLGSWLREEEGEDKARGYEEMAERAEASFNRRFWCAEKGHLYDVIDGEKGDDAACRPNQLLAFSLKHPVLDQERWKPVLEVVKERLLTPVGLRSLSREHPDYKPKYFGDLRSRDAAYHQGTVWGWLIGPFVDAWLKVYPARLAEARKFLEGFGSHLDAACVGSVSEVFDAEAPFTPRGCIAQAWSVGEVLRCWVKTAPPAATNPTPAGPSPV